VLPCIHGRPHTPGMAILVLISALTTKSGHSDSIAFRLKLTLSRHSVELPTTACSGPRPEHARLVTASRAKSGVGP
jgi:hypothetical protein